MNQNHLNDRQLVEHLYRDASESPSDWPAHLETCESCRVRLQGLQAVLARLDEPVMPEESVESNLAPVLKRLALPEPAGAVGQRGRTWRERMRLSPVLAASVLIVAACIGFQGGLVYQSRQLDAQLDSLVAQKVREQLQLVSLDRAEGNRNPDTLPPGDARAPGHRPDDRPNPIYQALARLHQEQVRLRKDLETLAINAEAELLMTNRELRAATQTLDRIRPVAWKPF
jgi:hypothetical protein